MAETDRHRNVMMALIQVLGYWFADKTDVYVSGNMPANWKKNWNDCGDPSRSGFRS